MRWFVLTVTVVVMAGLGVGFFLHARQGRTDVSVPQANTRVVTIPVEGMSCISCAATVKKTIQKIDGVTEVEVSLEHRAARVRYINGMVSPDQLVAAINHLGYQAGTPQAEETR